MANPLEQIQKIAGFGIQQGTKVVGTAVHTLQGLTGLGGNGDEPEPQQEKQEQKASTATQKRQRTQKAASQRRASRQPKDLDDVSITRKVETEIFRSNKVAKGKIDVNTADGVVWLRGEAKNPEQIKELEAKAAAIPEVKRVENLLHLPKTPAPTRTDTPASQRKTRTSKPAQSGRKLTSGRTTAERQTSAAPKEPAPADLAKASTGRQPAPLTENGGSSGTGSVPAASEPAPPSGEPAGGEGTNGTPSTT
jgi:osmotically-inducible protein OsmY